MIDKFKEKGIIESGTFHLKSGLISNTYINLKKIISYPDLHLQLCNEIFNKINKEENILICGTPYGAVPFASYISIKNDENLDKIISNIRSKLKNKFISTENTIITRERHRQHLINCVQHLEDFETKNSLEDFDKSAEDLRLATRQLGMIVGKIDVEEVLGSIFNDFCIGK